MPTRIFPARIRKRREGFTLLEALLALVVLLLAVQIVGQTLLTVVRASRLAALDRLAAIRVRNIACDVWMGVPSASFSRRYGDEEWTLASVPVPADADKSALGFPWELWSLSGKDPAFLSVDIAFTQRPILPSTSAMQKTPNP